MMVTKSELQKANEQMMAERRAALGDPPTTETLLAYSRGELASAEEERVRELLAAYPELARGIAEPFPRSGAAPGEADYLDDGELAVRWAALQQRMHGESEGTPVVRFHRRIELALAAMLVLAFGGILLQAQANRRMAHQLELPRVWQPQQLLPDGRRGPESGSPSLLANDDAYMLEPSLIAADRYPHYRAELLDTTSNPPDPRWNSGPSLELRENNTFAILVPGRFLSSGHRYQLVIYGVGDTAEERLAGYTFRVR